MKWTTTRLLAFSVDSHCHWLAGIFVKRWPTEKEWEVPGVFWLVLMKGFLGHCEIAMLAWVYCVKPNLLPWEDTEAIPFINTIKHTTVRGTTACPKCFVIALVLATDLRVGHWAVAQLDKLNVIGLTGPLDSKEQVAALCHQRQGDHIVSGQHRLSCVFNGLIHKWQCRQSDS